MSIFCKAYALVYLCLNNRASAFWSARLSPLSVFNVEPTPRARTCPQHRFDKDELRNIIKTSFAGLLEDSDHGDRKKDWNVITISQLDKVFELHLKIIELVEQRDIGRSGGPFEFNLRDLIKLRDVLEGNAHNMRDHYRYPKANTALANEIDEGPPDVRTLILNKFVSLVYARRFQSRDDQRRVQELINQVEYLGTGDDFLDIANPEVDSSVPGMVRIGTVYLEEGTSESSGGAHTRLVLSPDTIERLEALAAAVQSRSAVLLEGDTCSGKTALVKELARLCKRTLVVISLTHDTETSDLIGQWLPSTPVSQGAHKLDACIRELKKASSLLLVYIIPCLSVEGHSLSIRALNKTVREAFSVPIPALEGAAEVDPASVIDALTRTEEATKACAQPGIHVVPPYLRVECSRAASRLRKARALFEKSQPNQGSQDGDTKVSFEFVESQLVSAVRQGAWVLLDNINSAPPEVVERLNSLLEDEPTLNLIEMGSGEELTRENDGIHPELRIFATANTGRIGSNKMSSALLNRLLRLWLPALDAGLVGVGKATDDLEAHDLFAIVLDMLPNFSGKVKIAHLLLRFHAVAKDKADRQLLSLVGDAQVTFRTCMRAISCAITAAHKTGGRALKAFAWSILRNYVDCVRTRDGGSADASDLRSELSTLFQDTTIRDALGTSLNLARSGASSSPWLVDLADLKQAMTVVETLLQRALGMLLQNVSPPRFMALARALPGKGLVSDGCQNDFRDELCR